MDDPPLPGAAKDTVTCPSPTVAVTLGADGAPRGVTAGEAEDAAEAPMAFVACAVNV